MKVAQAMTLAVLMSSLTVFADPGEAEDKVGTPSSGIPIRAGQMPMMQGQKGIPMMQGQQGMPMMQMMQGRQAMMQQHMTKMEAHLANIEALLTQLVELQKK